MCVWGVREGQGKKNPRLRGYTAGYSLRRSQSYVLVTEAVIGKRRNLKSSFCNCYSLQYKFQFLIRIRTRCSDKTRIGFGYKFGQMLRQDSGSVYTLIPMIPIRIKLDFHFQIDGL